MCSIHPLTVHLVRGILAFALLAAAYFTSHSVLAIAAVISALFLLRGCPMCWLAGLIEKLKSRYRPLVSKDEGRSGHP